MKCSKCNTENNKNRTFCRECGNKLQQICTKCGFKNLPEDKFCGECGKEIEEKPKVRKSIQSIEGERRQVTSLFTDLSGYTAMSEKLDPEEVKEIMSRIFGETAQIVAKYEGYIDRFIGDEVMVLFGIPKAHEDDPVRAIKSAMEIHELVEEMNPKYEKRIGKSLSMHSGINTGLVVTGGIGVEKGKNEVVGDSINLASRLTSLARGGEILIGEETYRQAEGYFNFETLEPTKVKGKKEPVQAYKIISLKEKPITIHRLSGLRSTLIGRKAELAQLKEVIKQLQERKGAVISIFGDPGTGKSRLIEEIKKTLNLEKIRWVEGRAYAYSQNIPYFPLIDLLSRTWQIEESDSPEKVKEKVESHIQNLLDKEKDIAPYIGNLYGLKYPEIENVDPEFWKSRLFAAVKKILSVLTQRGL
ncbi:MAG: AAA family ATPase, partial [Actinomycetia bacterium]|nr:AAA family ATPase [Actinomycetes bacterium]